MSGVLYLRVPNLSVASDFSALQHCLISLPAICDSFPDMRHRRLLESFWESNQVVYSRCLIVIPLTFLLALGVHLGFPASLPSLQNSL